MRLVFIATAAAASLLGAACANTPTGAPATGAIAGPSYDGGVMYGSGNRAVVDAATMSGARTPPGADSLVTTSAARGGVMYGSGN